VLLLAAVLGFWWLQWTQAPRAAASQAVLSQPPADDDD
jgi:hypothetical protein